MYYFKFEREKKARILKLMDLDVEHKRLENEKLKAETKAILKDLKRGRVELADQDTRNRCWDEANKK